MDLPTCQLMLRNLLGCLTINNNGDLRNDFFNLTNEQVRHRFANLDLQDFAHIEASPAGWRMLYDYITRKRPPNTRTNINALDTVLREVQYDPVIQFALNEFQNVTDDRLIAFISLLEKFQDILPYYEEKMGAAQEATTTLEMYERRRTSLPQFLTGFYVGDVSKQEGIELSRDILQRHRNLSRSLNEFFRLGPANVLPRVNDRMQWITRFNTNFQNNVFDTNLMRNAAENREWQNIHLYSNRELSIIDFAAVSVLLNADLGIIEKIGNLPEAQPPSIASLKLKGITELVKREIINWETLPIEDLVIEEVEQRTSKLNQVDRSLNDYIMATGRDLASVIVNNSEYDVPDSLSTIKTQLVARRRHLEKIEKQEDADLKNKRTLINKSIPRYALQKLMGEENFLCWVNEYDMLKELVGEDELKLVALIKDSLEDKDDLKVTKKMTRLNDILKYLYKKYLNSSSLLTSTLNPIMSLSAPKSMAACVRNIEEVTNIFQVLEANSVIDRIDGDRLTEIETKCLTKQGLVDYYQAKQLARGNTSNGPARRGMGEIVDITIADRLGVPQPGANSTFAQRPGLDYTQMSFKTEIRRLMSAESIEFRREFFINYIEKKLEIFRSTMAAERTAEATLAHAKPLPEKKLNTKRNERVFSTQEREEKKKPWTPRGPLKPCPYNCGKEHPWGSGALCQTFKDIQDVEERIKIVNTFGVNKCCLKKVKHTPEKPCRARLCSCGAAHHELLCKKKKNIQSIHRIMEQNNDDEDDDNQDNDDNDNEEEDPEESHNRVDEHGYDVEDEDYDDDDGNGDEEEELEENHNRINEYDTDLLPDIDHTEETDEEEEEEDDGNPNEEENDDKPNDEEQEKVNSESEFEEEEEDTRVFSVRESDTLMLLESEEIQEKPKRNQMSIQKYLAAARDKLKKPFQKKVRKPTEERKTYVSYTEEEDVPFDTKPAKLDWEMIKKEGEEVMESFECEENQMPMIEQEIARVKLETIHEAPEEINNITDSDEELKKPDLKLEQLKPMTVPRIESFYPFTQKEKENIPPFREAKPLSNSTGTERPEPWPPPTNNPKTNIRELVPPKWVFEGPMENSLLGIDKITAEFQQKNQQLRAHDENEDIVVVKPNDDNKTLYKNLCQEADRLYSLRKRNSYGMIVKLRILAPEKRKTTKEKDLEVISVNGKQYIEVLGLLDCGADGSIVCSELKETFRFEITKTEIVTFTTINVKERRLIERTKLSLLTNEDQIINLESAGSRWLGHEKKIDRHWLDAAKDNLGMKKEHESLFDFSREGKIRVIIGLKNLKHLAKEVPLESIALKQSPVSPNLGIYFSPLDYEGNLCISGSIGLNKALFDDNYPVFEIERKIIHLYAKPRKEHENDADISEKEMRLFLTKTECNDLKTFLEEETMLHPENKKCEMHTKAIKNCNECITMNKVKSLEDQELYKTIGENMKAEKEGKNFRLVQKMVFTKPEAELFNPENSNYQEAVKSSKAMLFKLKRMGNEKVKEYDSQIKKSIKDGCFEKLTEDEIRNLEHQPHYFTMGNMVYNENSASTSVRFINDTSRPIKGQMASVSTSNYCPRKVLNDMYKTITRFLLYEVGYSSDVQGAYRGVKCTYEDSLLRLYVWFEDLDNPDASVVIYRRKSIDFGDGGASASLEIGCNKFVAEEARLEISKTIIRDFRYADNNFYSFKDKLLYFMVKKDIEEAFAKFSLPLKYTITNLDVDPSITSKYKLFDGTVERQMGLNWDVSTNTVIPATTLNIHGKKRGKQVGEPLTETDLDKIQITRRHLMRLCSQLHDYTERHIGPIKSSMKLLVSRACDIVDNANIDKPLENYDQPFAETTKSFLKNLKKIKDLKPFQRFVIPCGYKLNHLVVTRDGGGGGYAATIHFISRLEPGRIGEPWSRYIMAAKSKISKRSAQANELLATVLSALLLKLVLSGLTELNKEKFDIICAGDSVCISTFFDKRKQVKNVLVRNGVENCKSMLDDVINLFPKCNIRFTWINASLNVSDVMTKLTLDPIRICNSEVWRKGHEIFNNKEEMEKNTFFEVTFKTRNYYPLPDHLTGVKQNLQAAEALNKSYDSVSLKGGEDVAKSTTQNHERTLMVTTRANKASHNKIKTPILSQDSITKATTSLYTLPKTLKIESYEPQYIGIMKPELYENIMSKYSTMGKTFFFAKKIIVSYLKMKYAMLKTKLPEKIDFDLECWLAILRTSQNINKPRKTRNSSMKEVAGVSVMSLRLSPIDAEMLFGANVIPIIQDDSLLEKLIAWAHTDELSEGLGEVHLTITATSARIKSNIFRIITPDLKGKVSKYVNNCPTCLRESLKFYKAPQGDRYTKIRTDKVVMSELSADILGNISLLPYKGAKRPNKYYPLVYTDINFGCLVIDLIDSYKTEAVKLSLGKIQSCHTEILYLSTDAGSQLLKTNLEDKEIFPNMKVKNHEVNSQHRNYVERSIATVKKYMRTILKKVKREKLPCLTILQMEYLMTYVASIINKTPYSLDQENIYLCPKSFLSPAIPVTVSNNSEISPDNGKLKEYIAIANSLRKEQIIDATDKYKDTQISRNKRNVKDDEPRVNDIAYIHEANKFQSPRYAKIVGFKSKQTAILLTKKGLEEHPILNLHPFIKAKT